MSRVNRRLAFAVAATAVIAAAVVSNWTASRHDVRGDPVRAPIEFFDGATGDLADFAGTPVVINFWASWCPACIAELPDFAEVSRETAGDVVFLGFNVQEISLDGAMHLIEETGVDYRLVHDRDGALYREFGAIAMPATVFIDSDGLVVRVHNGVLFADDLRRIIESELLS
ncbi:MAG: TlpA disulfide reductase family protein [Acidimicrobiia bacterium]